MCTKNILDDFPLMLLEEQYTTPHPNFNHLYFAIKFVLVPRIYVLPTEGLFTPDGSFYCMPSESHRAIP